MVEVNVPLCTECEHCVVITWEQISPTEGRSLDPPAYRCMAMAGMPNPITGDPIVNSDCGWMRLGCDCSREGKLFKPKGGRQ